MDFSGASGADRGGNQAEHANDGGVGGSELALVRKQDAHEEPEEQRGASEAGKPGEQQDHEAGQCSRTGEKIAATAEPAQERR